MLNSLSSIVRFPSRPSSVTEKLVNFTTLPLVIVLLASFLFLLFCLLKIYCLRLFQNGSFGSEAFTRYSEEDREKNDR